jgi:hypothetical protein
MPLDLLTSLVESLTESRNNTLRGLKSFPCGAFYW